MKTALILMFVFIATVLCQKPIIDRYWSQDLDSAFLPEMERKIGVDVSRQWSRTSVDSNTTLIGRWANGPCWAVDVSSNIAFFGNGGYLEIIDFSITSDPIELGKILMPSFIQSVVFQGIYIFVTAGSEGLRIIDVSTPTSPMEVGFYDTDGWANEIAISGNYAYIADYDHGLRIIDISSPTYPVEVGFYNGGYIAFYVAISGNFAYVTLGWDGLMIIDVSAPTSPVEVGFYDTNEFIGGISVNGSYVYTAVGIDGLKILDVSIPSNPIEVGSYNTGSQAKDLEVIDNYVYLADWQDGLRIIDVSTPSNPIEVGYYDTGDWAVDIAVSDDNVYVADYGEGLRVIDVSIPSSPNEVGYYNTGDWAFDVEVKGNYAYVADGSAGLFIIDISVPSIPVEVGYYNTNSEASSLVVVDSFAYITDTYSGLRIIDISVPSSLNEVGFFDTGDLAMGVTVSGNYAYVADWEDGLRIIDISNPASPNEVGFYNTGGAARDVAINGNYAYVADNQNGLRIIDVSFPSSPIEVGFYDTNGSARGVTISGDYAILADYSAGLRIIDISLPSDPVEVGSYEAGGWANAYNVTVSGNYVYVANGYGGLKIIDISIPTNPVEVGFYFTNGTATGVAVSGSYSFVANGNDGLYIIRNDLLLPTTVTVTVPELNAFPSDTILMPIHVEFPLDSLFSSAEITIGGYQSGLDFISVTTDSSLTGDAGWTYAANENGDSLLVTWLAGSQDISSSGVFCWLKFVVTGEPCTFVPVNIESAVFNTGTDSVTITNGGVHIEAIPDFGDADANGNLQAYDASTILKHLVGLDSLTCQGLANAEVSCNDTITAYDASLILQKGVGLIDSLPWCETLLAVGDFNVEDVSINAGQEFDFPINIYNGGNIYSYEGVVRFDSEQITLTDITWQSGDSLSDSLIPGELHFAGASATAHIGEGSFAVLHFTANANFSGQTTITIEKLQLNENPVIDLAATATVTLGIRDEMGIPGSFSLHQNYPNPFNPVTTIRYDLPEQAHVEIVIYDIMGRKVIKLLSQMQKAGFKSVIWDATDDHGKPVSAGMYLYRIKAGSFEQVKKMVLLK